MSISADLMRGFQTGVVVFIQRLLSARVLDKDKGPSVSSLLDEGEALHGTSSFCRGIYQHGKK